MSKTPLLHWWTIGRFCAVLTALACGSAQARDFVRIADTNTPIPGGVGNFTGFDSEILLGAGNAMVTFRGFGAGGQEGIYSVGGTGGMTLIADRSSIMPVGGDPVAFQSFSAPSGGNSGPTFFQASGGGISGIFRAGGGVITTIDSAPVASTVFGRPGGMGTDVAYWRNGVVMSSRNGGAPVPEPFAPPIGVSLQSFGDPDLGSSSLGVRVNYLESGQPRSGMLYRRTGVTTDQILFAGPSGSTGEASVNSTDTAAVIQGGGQTLAWRHGFFPIDQTLNPPGGYDQFLAVSAGSPTIGPWDTEVVFSVSGGAGEALYYYGRPYGAPPDVYRIIGSGDQLDGRIINGVTLGRDSESFTSLAFLATFTDGSSGIYITHLIPEPAAGGVLALGMLVLLKRHKSAT